MYQLMAGLLDPFLLFFLLTAVGVAYVWRQREVTRGRLCWLTIAFVGLFLSCFPVAAFLAVGTLEWAYPPKYDLPEQTDTIIVLGGAVRPPNALRRRTELEEETMARCVRAAELYHEGGPRPLLVCGGVVDADRPAPAVAEAMSEFLMKLGVNKQDLLIEDSSTSTYENAVNAARLLRRRGFQRIVVVTTATHLLRSELCFREQGFEVVPRGCFYRSTEFEWSPWTFLPNPSAARSTKDVMHEWIGLAWYRLKGRI